ncbi:MAG: protein translocase subunit SecD [Candidatus Hydrogenedentes bacterium]|nr:protein translocase subunit SecD [Candidatus Hydrogenedentota bacterium]
MKKHLARTLLIYATLVVAAIYVYPTIGWMTLSPNERTARLDAWKAEDDKVERLSAWEEATKKVRRWAMCDRDMVINLGLDLQGGVQMVVGINIDGMDPAAKQKKLDIGMSESDILDEMQQQVLQTIERRASEFGAKEPIIQTMGDRQIQVQLPGEQDVERARRLIMQTAYLTFHIAAGPDQTAKALRDIDTHFKGDLLKRLQKPAPGGDMVPQIPLDQIDYVRELIAKAKEVPGLIPEGFIIAFGGKPKPWDQQSYGIYLLHEETMMTGDGLTQSLARPDDKTGGSSWMILFELDSASGRIFGERTKANIGNPMAIVVDKVVESAPVIRDQITTSGSITGHFVREEAQDLAIALNSGSLPVPIVEEQTGVVGPRLGAESITKGVWSALIGLILVVVFMPIYYRLAGLVANIALVLNAVLIIAALAYFGATLTLPGIAGLILTIGMAVDANVLIFERMREEIRNGKSLAAAIDGGFAHATPAIMDSNVTTLIAAVVLFQFGSGPIEGFAVTLGIGVCASVFSALVISRAIFDFFATRKWIKSISMASIIRPDSRIPFMQYRRAGAIVSIAGIVIGLGLFAMRGNDNFGVEFSTGTNLVLNIANEQQVSDADVRTALTTAGFVEPTVTEYESEGVGAQNRFMVHLGEAVANADSGESTISARVQETLKPLAGGDATKVEIEKEDMVGPTVGRQLKWDALKAIIYSIIFIVIYLWFRFELNFSVGAIIAIVHDVAITLGFFALTGRQISLGVVAAILTVIGYSLNDTIIVYDRIREDIKLYRGRGLSLLEIMNRSVNETLSRTLLTSGTTLFVVLVLYFFGGDTINDFAFALLIGIVVGTYSSIFIASPVVYYWNQWRDRVKYAGKKPDEGPSQRRRKKSEKTNSVENPA